MIELLIVTLILGFGGLLRLAYSSAETTDDWVSYWLIGRQRGSRWVNYDVRDSLLEGTYGYPSLQHFLVSRLPRRWWGLAGRLSNLSYDLLVAVCVYFIAAQLVNDLRIDSTIAGLSLPCTAMLLFLTTPGLMPVQARMATIKGRSLGMLWTTLYLIGLGSFIGQPNGWGLVLAVIAGELAILTSQFALQVVVLFSVFLSLILLSTVPLAVLLTVLAIGYAIPKLGTRPVLQFYVNHKIWYLRNYNRGTTAAARNALLDYLRLPLVLLTDPQQFLNLVTRRLSLVVAVCSAPLAFVVAAAYFWGWPASAPSAGVNLLSCVVLASGCAFVATSFPLLSSFGQAERYFEYSAFAFCPLFAIMLAAVPAGLQPGLFWLTFVGQTSMVLLNLSVMKRHDLVRSQATIPGELHDVVNWVQRHVGSGQFLTVPSKLGFLLSPVLNKEEDERHRLYYRFVKRPGEIGFRYFEQDMGGLSPTADGWTVSFDVLRKPPSQLAEDYGATHVIADKRYEAGLQKSWHTNSGSHLPLTVFENDRYVVYEIRAVRKCSGAIAA